MGKRGECINGQCKCFHPFKGEACEFADCPVPCGEHGSCDNAAGKCKCVGLWAGAQCNVRACPKQCSGHGMCSSRGVCHCEHAWIKEDCSEHKCEIKCVNGMCNKSTGGCDCKKGFFGKDCSKKKCIGKGVSCTAETCRCGPTWAQSECDYHRGICQCKKGVSLAKYFFSSNCAKKKCPGLCDEKTKSCSCSGHGKCDYAKGVCGCAPGYTGNNCAFHIQVEDEADARMKKYAAKETLLHSAMAFHLGGELDSERTHAASQMADLSSADDMHQRH